MDGFTETVLAWFQGERMLALIKALTLLAVGLILGRLLGRALARVAGKALSPHQVQLARRAISYFVVIVFATSALHELGFQLSILLGAAGVLSVALGFASQTSAANLVSGLFLIAEHPFGIGDVIRIGGTTGEVISINLLSIRLRTFDNLAVRIPNESVIKAEVTNLTHYPIRRLDLTVGVAYKEDLEKVRDILVEVADRNPLCLEEPRPLIIMLGFGDSSMNLQFSVWAARQNFLQLRNTIQPQIKRAFDREGIEIPFPHLSLYAGSVTAPLPVSLVPGPAGPASGSAEPDEAAPSSA